MSNIKIIAFYSKDNNRGPSFLAASNKLDYIIKCFSLLGHSVEVLSLSTISNTSKCLTEKKVQLNESVVIKYPKAFPVNNIMQRFFRKAVNKGIINNFLKKNIDNGDLIYIYHSEVDHLLLKRIVKKKRAKIILEIEEIYGDVSNNKKLVNNEIRFFNFADAYVFPTILLNNKINHSNKPYIIIHGTYDVPKRSVDKFDDGKIHCVYAGTFDVRKGGALAALNSIPFLKDNYCIHILGFGNKSDTNTVINRIQDLNKTYGANAVFEGLKTGDEFLSFIQKCQIGLSTQNPCGEYNDTSFPSKVLSYMANGLIVVSVRIPVVETSDVSKCVVFAKSNSGKDIADAIMRVDLSGNPDCQRLIADLNDLFIKKMRIFLDEVF